MNSSQHSKIIRASLVIAILATFAVGVLNGIKVREKIRRLQSGLQEQTVARYQAEAEVTRARRDLEATAASLNQTKITLQTVTAEKESALASAASQAKRADQLDKELMMARREGDEARAELARYRSGGMQPEQIVRAAELIRKLQSELGVARTENKALHIQVKDLAEQLPEADCIVKLPAGLDGRVLVADPKWQFVVLDAGENQGVLKRGELLVNRGGKLVAKVMVTRVEQDRCVATVMPGWGLGAIAEGDRAIPAHPGS
jgi:hypothetical protein